MHKKELWSFLYSYKVSIGSRNGMAPSNFLYQWYILTPLLLLTFVGFDSGAHGENSERSWGWPAETHLWYVPGKYFMDNVFNFRSREIKSYFYL